MGYIYHTVTVGLANPVDITPAVAVPEGQSPFADIMLKAATSNDMAVNLTANIIVNLNILKRECNLTRDQLDVKAKSGVIYQISESSDDGVKLTFYLYPVNIKYQSRLVHNDEVVLNCELLHHFNASEADILVDLQAALEGFYLPADLGGLNPHWSNNYAAPLSEGASGPYLREYPGLLVESSEARERKERAICEEGAADGMVIYDFDLGVSRPIASSIQLGEIAENLADGTYKVISFIKIGANIYALKSPDWDSLDYDTDYGAVNLGGIEEVGGGLVTSKYHLPRGLFGRYVVRSKEFYIGRCRKGDDWDAGGATDEYGYFQMVQVVGSAIPESDSHGYKLFKTTSWINPETDVEAASDWRERLFIGESVDDIIVSVEVEYVPPVPSWWYFDANSIGWGGPIPEGPNEFTKNLFIPVRSYVTFEYEVGIGEPMQKPPIRVFKRDRWRKWTNYSENLEGRVDGPGPFDTFNYTYIGDVGEGIEVEPGYYAFGALGEPVITNRQNHPWKSGGGWGETSGFLQDPENRIPPFRLTIEPVEYPIIIQKVAEYDVSNLVAVRDDKIDLDFTDRIDNMFNYEVDKINLTTGVITDLNIVGDKSYYLINDNGDFVFIECTLDIPGGGWSAAFGVNPIGSLVYLMNWNNPPSKIIFRTIDKKSNADSIITFLTSGIYDYKITGLMPDGAEGYLVGIQKKIYTQKQLPFEIQIISWYLDEPGDEGSFPGGKRTGGFILVRGDATDKLKGGDHIRLYVPPYKRSAWDPDKIPPGLVDYEQDRFSYPLKHRVVSVTYLSDENKSNIVIDPPPDRTCAWNTNYSVIENGSAIQHWDSEDTHDIPSVASAKPSVWKVEAERQWVSELWQVPKSALDSLEDDITDLVIRIAQAIDSITETLNPTWSDTYLAYSTELKETEIDITSVELSESVQYLLIRGDNGKYNFVTNEKKDNVEITYDYYTNLPYQFGAGYVWQNGRIYEYNGSLTRLYSDSELPKSYLVGDPAELANGNIVAPIYYDGTVRLVVIDKISATYGAAVRPKELSDNPKFTELLSIPKAFGLVANKEGGTWELGQIGNVAINNLELESNDILDVWEEDNWCEGEPVPRILYGDNGKYPVAISTGQDELDVSNTFVNLDDAKAVYSKREILFNNDNPLLCYKVRLNPNTLDVIRNLGRMFNLDKYEAGEVIGNSNAILYSVDFKLNTGTAICKFVEIS